jgi:hypothetical protein
MLAQSMRRWPSLPPVACAAVGGTGAAAIAAAAPRLVGHVPRWWFSPQLAHLNTPILYAGMTALVIAWLLLARASLAGAVSPAKLSVIGGLWSVPLLLGPPLFSHDVYSYLAQGTIAHLGLSPYDHPPTVLAHLGHRGVLDAVSPFWRHTTAPYGPLFIWLLSGLVGVTGTNVTLGVVVVRAINALGLVLLAIYVPRLARRLGTPPARATWLVVLNPLLLLQLLAPGHNDLLMAGGMCLGIVFALDGRALVGIAICSLAAMIKAPALAAVGFVAVAWIRSLPAPDERARAALEAVLICVAVLAVVSVLSGLGTGWLSSSVFSTPNRVHLAITPATALGWTAATLAHHAGIHVNTKHLESALALVALALVAALALERIRRVERSTLVRRLGVVLVAFAAGGPAAWPWYLAWGFVLLAACPPGRLALALPIVSIVGAFVVKPDGILALPIESSPATLAVFVAAGAVAWWRTSRPRQGVVHAAA